MTPERPYQFLPTLALLLVWLHAQPVSAGCVDIPPDYLRKAVAAPAASAHPQSFLFLLSVVAVRTVRHADKSSERC